MGNWLISKEVKKHDLGDGEWIEYKADISYEEFSELFVSIDLTNKSATIKLAKPLLKSAIVNWNLKDKDGNVIPFSLEKIDDFSAGAILILASPMLDSFMAEKKNSSSLNQSMEKVEQEKELKKSV